MGGVIVPRKKNEVLEYVPEKILDFMIKKAIETDANQNTKQANANSGASAKQNSKSANQNTKLANANSGASANQNSKPAKQNEKLADSKNEKTKVHISAEIRHVPIRASTQRNRRVKIGGRCDDLWARDELKKIAESKKPVLGEGGKIDEMARQLSLRQSKTLLCRA